MHQPLLEKQHLLDLRLPDGRQLIYRTYGAPLGAGTASPASAVYFHGIPSCCLEAAALDDAARELGVTIISFDRPGIGGSSLDPRSSLKSVAADAKQLLDSLQQENVIVIGTSGEGGGPYASAFATLYPETTASLVLLCALGPSDARHRHLRATLQGMDYAMLRLVPWRAGLVWLMHLAMKYMAYHHPKTLLRYAPEGMAAVDGALLTSDPALREGFKQCLQHAYLRGARGMARDAAVLAKRWPMDVGRIRCRTVVWQGDQDKTVPVPHAHWYAGHIPGAHLRIMAGEGHVTLLVNHAKIILEAAAAAATGAG